MKYRKKPVVIEAIQFTQDSKDQCFNFVTCNRMPSWDDEGILTLTIQTLEGNMVASMGDYIIKGVRGEFYPCKPEIFEATYEKVD